MPNGIKYSTTIITGSLLRNNVALGVNTDLAPSATTGWYNGPNPPTSGLYQIIETNAAAVSKVYSPQNDAELIQFARWKGATGTDTGSVAAVLTWIAAQSNLMAANFQYENIVTDGLVLNLDAGFVGSYPTSASKWYDLSGNNYTGSLINSPTFNTANSGSFVFGPSQNYVSVQQQSALINASQFTLCAWMKRGNNGSGSLYLTAGTFGNGTTTCFKVGFSLGAIPGGSANFITANPANCQTQISSTVTASLNWIYYVGVFDGTQTGNSNRSKFYWNGISQSVNYTNTVPATTGNVNTVLSVGLFSDFGYYQTGSTAIVQLYNRALTPTEVLQNFNAQRGRFGV